MTFVTRAINQIVAALGLELDLREWCDETSGGNIVGNQRAAAERHAFSPDGRFNGHAAVAAWSSLFGLIALLPWAGWEMWRFPVHFTVQAIGAAVYLGVVVTVAGLILWLNLLRTVPARIAASVQYLQPVVGIAAASVMFGDKLGATFAGGVLFILGGLVLTIFRLGQAGSTPTLSH